MLTISASQIKNKIIDLLTVQGSNEMPNVWQYDYFHTSTLSAVPWMFSANYGQIVCVWCCTRIVISLALLASGGRALPARATRPQDWPAQQCHPQTLTRTRATPNFYTSSRYFKPDFYKFSGYTDKLGSIWERLGLGRRLHNSKRRHFLWVWSCGAGKRTAYICTMLLSPRWGSINYYSRKPDICWEICANAAARLLLLPTVARCGGCSGGAIVCTAQCGGW